MEDLRHQIENVDDEIARCLMYVRDRIKAKADCLEDVKVNSLEEVIAREIQELHASGRLVRTRFLSGRESLSGGRSLTD